jgi:peptidoglycan/LPS O-acetylase OafA/YrhL
MSIYSETIPHRDPPPAAVVRGVRSPDAAHAAFRRTAHFGSLDGVRCLSILAVIWHHSMGVAARTGIASRGFLGVDMFFVLSGFLIITLLLRERERTGSISLRNFYVRRSLRIFPIFYLLLLGVAVAMLAFRPGTETARWFWADLPYLATYTSNWVPVHAVNLALVWSLATEEQFYLVWPNIERRLRPPAVLAVLGLVLVGNQLVNFGVAAPLLVRWFGSEFLHLSIVITTFTPIALGVMLAHAMHRRRSYALLYHLVGHRWSPVALGGGLAVLCAVAPNDISGLPRLAIQVIMMLLLASLVAREDHVARPVLAWRPVARLGMISYGMYLYHMFAMSPILTGFRTLGFENRLVYFVAAVAATAVVAELSFRFIETPMLKLKRRFGGA